MGQRDSKYDIVIDTLKKYELYDKLYSRLLITKNTQVNLIYEIAYDILSTSIWNCYGDNIKIEFADYNRYSINFDYGIDIYTEILELVICVNNLTYRMYLWNPYNKWWIVENLKQCIFEICCNINEQYKQSIKDFSYFSIPNDIKWLICKYI